MGKGGTRCTGSEQWWCSIGEKGESMMVIDWGSSKVADVVGGCFWCGWRRLDGDGKRSWGVKYINMTNI